MAGLFFASWYGAEGYTKIKPSPMELTDFFETEGCGVSQVIAIAPSSLGETLTDISKAMVVITLMFLQTILKVLLCSRHLSPAPCPPDTYLYPIPIRNVNVKRQHRASI